jgi:chorismate synthase
MLRFITSGESHGPGLVATVEGLPAGLEVLQEGIADELARRRLGYGRGPRMRLERDELEILGGVRFGRTLGGPVTVLIRNTEWPRWQDKMSQAPLVTDTEVAIKRETTPRPGHADLVGMQKYDTHDARDILERASARETAARTVVGYLAKQLLRVIGVEVFSHVVAIGSVQVPSDASLPEPSALAAIDASEVRVFNSGSAVAMIAEIEAAKADKDTLGGVIEVLAYGLPPGLGSHVHWDRKLDGLLAGALMSIQAIKAVEIGDGLRQATARGSVAHDEIVIDASDAVSGGYARRSNHAGGLEGGMTTGGVLRVKAAMKPISTVMHPLDTVDVDTKTPDKAFRERSDVCAVPAAGVVAEQMVAYVLANEVMRKFGGDTVEDIASGVAAYRARLETF